MSKKKDQTNVLDIKKTLFEHFLSSKMGRGVLAVVGGSGGKPMFDPKSVQTIQDRRASRSPQKRKSNL